MSEPNNKTKKQILQEMAERELLELVQQSTETGNQGRFHSATKNFTLMISVDAGKWDVEIDDHDSGRKTSGSGQSFGEAWVWPSDKDDDEGYFEG
jgi:hypothetical protein